MIRRGFWLAVGAVGGIVAYRRVAHRPWARETVRFARDVRAGMDLYMSRHPGRVGPTLGAGAVAARGDDRSPGMGAPAPGGAPDGKTRHRAGRAHDDEKDDR